MKIISTAFFTAFLLIRSTHQLVTGAIRYLLMLVCVVLLKLSLTLAPDNTVQCYLVILSSLANWLAETLLSDPVSL